MLSQNTKESQEIKILTKTETFLIMGLTTLSLGLLSISFDILPNPFAKANENNPPTIEKQI